MDNLEVVVIGVGSFGVGEADLKVGQLYHVFQLVALEVDPGGGDIGPHGGIRGEAGGSVSLEGGRLLIRRRHVFQEQLQVTAAVHGEGEVAIRAGGVIQVGIHGIAHGLLAVRHSFGAGDGIRVPGEVGVVVVVDTGRAAADIAGVGIGEQKLNVLGGLSAEIHGGGDGRAGELGELLLALGVVVAEEPGDVQTMLFYIAVQKVDNGGGVGDAVAVAAGPGVGGLSAVLVDAHGVQSGVGGDDDQLAVVTCGDVVQRGLDVLIDGIAFFRAIAVVVGGEGVAVLIVQADDDKAGAGIGSDACAGTGVRTVIAAVEDDAGAADALLLVGVIRCVEAEIGCAVGVGVLGGVTVVVVAGDPDGVDARQLERHTVDALIGAAVEVIGLGRFVLGFVAGQLVVVEVAGGDDERGDQALGGNDGVIDRLAHVVPGFVDVGEGDEGVLLYALGQDHVDVHVDGTDCGIRRGDFIGVERYGGSAACSKLDSSILINIYYTTFGSAAFSAGKAIIELPACLRTKKDL